MKLALRSTSAHAWQRAYNLLAVAAIIFAAPSLSAQPFPKPVVFHVSLGQASATAVSSRLLVFAKLLGSGDKRPVTAGVIRRSTILKASAAHCAPCTTSPSPGGMR